MLIVLEYANWMAYSTDPAWSVCFFFIWAQLFKANDVVKIYIEWYANMLKFFAEKMWVAMQKLLTFFQQKVSEYYVLNPLKQLTKCPLTSLLS